jgi:hypothetical protein
VGILLAHFFLEFEVSSPVTKEVGDDPAGTNLFKEGGHFVGHQGFNKGLELALTIVDCGSVWAEE